MFITTLQWMYILVVKIIVIDHIALRFFKVYGFVKTIFPYFLDVSRLYSIFILFILFIENYYSVPGCCADFFSPHPEVSKKR
jgi:hypothetical protein